MGRIHVRAPGRGRWYVVLAVLGVLGATVAPSATILAGASPNAPGAAAATGSAQASSSTVPAGRSVTAQSYRTPPKPTAEQLRQAAEGTSRSSRSGPQGTIATGPFPAPSGPAMAAPRSSRAPGDFKVMRNTNLAAGGQRSAVDEPSTDANGKNVFATGNWYAAYSKDNAQTWSYLNPFTIFGSGYCCDQVTMYDVSHNRQYWLLQYGDHLTLAGSGGGNLASWCFYNWNPASFGLPSTDAFDYNHMGLSTRFAYFSTNVYSTSGFAGALVARFPLAEMSTCSGFSYNWVFRSTEFADSFVQPASDTMYWGTNWTTNLANGSTFRVLRWADDSGTYFWYDRNIDAYSFMTVNSGQNCGSQNGVVLNWCQRTDSRQSGGGYLAVPSLGQDTFSNGQGHDNDAIVGFAFNAKNDGGHPFPYIRRVYFRASDLAYFGYAEQWGTFGAFLYPDMAADSRGHVGTVWAWGGGTGSTAYYPGSGVSIDDDYSPTQPWAYNYVQFGAGNPCLNSDGFRRWGDYLTVRPWSPSRYSWIMAAFRLTANAGSCGSTASVEVKNYVFGRVRDVPSYKRWSGK